MSTVIFAWSFEKIAFNRKTWKQKIDRRKGGGEREQRRRKKKKVRWEEKKEEKGREEVKYE